MGAGAMIGCRGLRDLTQRPVVQRGKKAGALETFNRDVTKHFFFPPSYTPKDDISFPFKYHTMMLHTAVYLLERNVVIIKVSVSLTYVFSYLKHYGFTHGCLNMHRVYGFQFTRWLCTSNLFCYPLWWLSRLRNIPQDWLFCTKLVYKHHKQSATSLKTQ